MGRRGKGGRMLVAELLVLAAFVSRKQVVSAGPWWSPRRLGKGVV